MKNKGLIATIVVLIAVIITLITVVFLMQMPTIISVNSIKNMQNAIEKYEPTTEIVEPTTEIIETIESKPQLDTVIDTYIANNDHVRINYPEVHGMKDTELQNNINNKIKMNALSIVPLYPISTSLQYLDINCEVATLNEDYVTILYKGTVVGNSVVNQGSSNSTTSSNRSSSTQAPATSNRGYDPYLDGFVDPLLTQTAPMMDIFTQQNNINVAPPATQDTNKIEVYSNYNSTPKVGDSTHTEDKGPTVHNITAPTAPRNESSFVPIENYSENNPTGGSIYGFTGTNLKNDASTIDQKIFFTNTIDLNTGLDLTLKDFVSDIEALGKYIRSSKVEFDNIEDSNKKAVREYINKTVLSKLVENLKNADFRNDGVKSWPKVFSYKGEDGTVYIALRLGSKLGNYAIVKYNK